RDEERRRRPFRLPLKPPMPPLPPETSSQPRRRGGGVFFAPSPLPRIVAVE
ncbi:hypothetical protein S83_001956, partial [Arachis hypogaea]